MLTPTSKLFLPVAGVALFLGAVYKILSGDLLGSVLYLLVGTAAFLLGVMLSSIRENEYAPAMAPDAPPPGVRPVAVAPLPGGGGWPVAAGIAVALVMVGVIEHPLFVWAGVLVGMAAGAGWLARSAAESTGRQISLLPIGLPVLGLATIASVMYFLSRILLAVPEAASTRSPWPWLSSYWGRPVSPPSGPASPAARWPPSWPSAPCSWSAAASPPPRSASATSRSTPRSTPARPASSS